MAKKDDSEIGKEAPALSASLGAELPKDGGKIGFKMNTHSIEVAKEILQLLKLTIGAGTGAVLGARFGGGPGAVAGACIGTGIVSFDTLLQDRRAKALVKEAVTVSLGDNTINQAVLELGTGSLLVSLHCFTDERFLEVLEDHKSEKIKGRLEKEFEKFGFKVKGLTVEIANKEEVNKTKRDIIRKRIRSSIEVVINRQAKTTKTRRQDIQIRISKEHGNWLNVGELIRSIQKPISIYVDEIVQALHDKLRKDLLHVGKCSTPEDCNKKTNPNDLCRSCKSWFDRLAASHEKGKNPSWHKNCNSARWPEDHWEVAKFFMPPLGSSTVKNAESTDISSLLYLLEWLNNSAFLGKTRVNVDLVRKLRSEVRNTWAHAPRQESSDDEMADGFKIATDFLEDLEKVWPHRENGKCLQHLEDLKTDGVTEVTESELQSLRLQRRLLANVIEEKREMEVERSPDKSTDEEHKREPEQNSERAMVENSLRLSIVLPPL